MSSKSWWDGWRSCLAGGNVLHSLRLGNRQLTPTGFGEEELIPGEAVLLVASAVSLIALLFLFLNTKRQTLVIITLYLDIASLWFS